MMDDKLTPSIIEKAVTILKEHKVTGDYEIRVNIVHFQELVNEIFNMVKQVIIGYYDRDLPTTMLIGQLNNLEKQIQENLGKKIK